MRWLEHVQRLEALVLGLVTMPALAIRTIPGKVAHTPAKEEALRGLFLILVLRNATITPL
jgi:hypothetical protein